MNQIVLSGFGDDLAATIRDHAEREQISTELAALSLLRQGAGLDRTENGSGKIGSSLDDFIGTWTEEEAAEVQSALREMRAIDEA